MGIKLAVFTQTVEVDLEDDEEPNIEKTIEIIWTPGDDFLTFKMDDKFLFGCYWVDDFRDLLFEMLDALSAESK